MTAYSLLTLGAGAVAVLIFGLVLATFLGLAFDALGGHS